MLVNKLLFFWLKSLFIEMRKGEELKAPRHASATATRDDRLPHSRHWQLFFCGCHLYIQIPLNLRSVIGPLCNTLRTPTD